MTFHDTILLTPLSEVVDRPTRHSLMRIRLLQHAPLIGRVNNSLDLPRGIKWIITSIIASASCLDTISMHIFTPSLPQLPNALSTTPTMANLSVALTAIGSGLLPLYWSRISETCGRRPTYLISLFLFIVFSIGSAISTNIKTLITLRVFAAAAGSAVTPLGPAVIGDIWEAKERGAAMSWYYIGPLAAPALGPILGGVLAQKFGWTGGQWFLAGYAAILLILVFFCLPETIAIVPSDSLNIKVQEKLEPTVHRKLSSMVYSIVRCIYEPFSILSYLRFPAIAISIYITSVSFGTIMMVCISLQRVFSLLPYSFTPTKVGLTFLPMAIGLVIGDIAGGRWSDLIMKHTAITQHRYDSNDKLMVVPEDRLGLNLWIGVLAYPATIIWYGWSVAEETHWIVPLLSLLFMGAALGLLFSLITTVLIELQPNRSASLIALNSLGRNAFSAAGMAATEPLIEGVGIGWTGMLLAGWAALNTVGAWAIKNHGQRWREKIQEIS